MTRLPLLSLVFGLCLAGGSGCNSGGGSAVTVPPKPTEHALVGLSLQQVKAQLGKPQSESEMKTSPHFGPFPDALLPQESTLNLYYPSYQGEQTHLFLAAPAVYQRITGKQAGDDAWYVIAVYTYPQGTVF